MALSSPDVIMYGLSVFSKVHTAILVGVEAEGWCGVGYRPDFDSAVEAGGSKGICVFLD
jgi:hypothetical protein